MGHRTLAPSTQGRATYPDLLGGRACSLRRRCPGRLRRVHLPRARPFQGVSSEAVGWAFRHSPYKHGAFAVHVALADTANDLYDYEIWFKLTRLAEKARVGRNTAQAAVAAMVRDGYLETLKARGGGRLGAPAVYRFVFVEGVPVVFEQKSTGPNTGRPKTGPVANNTSNEDAPQVQLADSCPLIEPKEPKGVSRTVSRSTRIVEDFTVIDEMREWATAKGIRSDLAIETERFIDYYVAKGDTRVNWVAAWRNWIRNADKYLDERPDPTQSKSAAARARVRAQLPPDRLELPA